MKFSVFSARSLVYVMAVAGVLTIITCHQDMIDPSLGPRTRLGLR